ncbi:telomerase-binding protein EST1A-like [Amphibalanus amphitrite]|uniref:telomerase-binding protein EST1A-like n=1 Tax=Amphibalanus amphitrite TaxID=1232801 RepID=UPI001C9106D2|nr:telomerase-binding protein EST1A-like [Amphibalanus amphitrite]
MSSKDPAKKTKRPDMAIYMPRGRRSQEEAKRSPEVEAPPQPVARKDPPPPQRRVPAHGERGDTRQRGGSTSESDTGKQRTSVGTSKGRREQTESESSKHRRSRDTTEKGQGYSSDDAQHRTTMVFTRSKPGHFEEPRQRRPHRAAAERSRRFAEGSDRAAEPPSKGGVSVTTSSASINDHRANESAGTEMAKSFPEAARRKSEESGVHAIGTPTSEEHPVDLTPQPVDLSLKPTKEGVHKSARSSADDAARTREPSPGTRRRPRGAVGVYVPRAARRHSDSTGEPVRPPDDPPQPGAAGRDRGDAAVARQSGAESAASCGRSDGGRRHDSDRSEGIHRHHDSDRSDGSRRHDSDRSEGSHHRHVSGRSEGSHRRHDSGWSEGSRRHRGGDGESSRTASPRADFNERRRDPSREELRSATEAPVSRSGRTSASSQPEVCAKDDPPAAPVSGRRTDERQRPLSPPAAELAAVALGPAARTDRLTEPAGPPPHSGLLYVPGGPHSDPPEPPHSYTQPPSRLHPHSHPHSQPHSRPQQPQPRHLYDPNNPGQVLEVTPRAVDARERRYQDPPREYVDPRGGGADPQAAGCSDSFSPSSNATNANRISQLLGRTAGEIEYLIASGRLLDSWVHTLRLRNHVKAECAQVLVTDLRTWMTLGIDQTIWKSFYYCVIEKLRDVEPPGQELHLCEVIDDGVLYFTALLNQLETTYAIPVWRLGSLLHDPEPIRRQRYFSSVAALSQRLLLCVGDLARYQYHLGRVPNLAEPYRFYLQAQKINPKNGRPFNQLAIVTLFAHRRLDCVYLYARALMAANPFHTAKESLLSLFHESSRRYAANSPMPGQVAAPAAERRQERRGADLRTEVWVHPNRGDRLRRTLPTAADEPPELADLRITSNADLLKAFVTTYLHVQGKLYTRVSLESYQEDACVMLRQFSEMLSREPMPFKADDMLHILGIIMFNIANTKLKDERLGSDLRSTYQELALAVAIEMAGHVIQRACQLLSGRAPDAGERLFEPASLETCMVFVKVWCDWLLSSSAVWNPPPCTADYRVCDVADCWESLAELTNLLRQRDGGDDDDALRPSAVLGSTSSGEPSERVVRLPEDISLESFTPLLCAQRRVAFVDVAACSVDRARDLLRLRCVLFVTEEFLCGTEPAPLRLVKTADGACRYISQVSSHAPAPEDDGRPESPDVEVEWSAGEEEEGAGRRRSADEPLPPLADLASRPRLARLQQQKLALERRVRRQEEHSRRVQAIVSSAHASVTLEVRPRYLVADTNCYVDYLDQLRRLVTEHGAYTLTVPVTVLAELDGLSRPGGGGRPRPGQSEQHVQQVRRTARAALAFVQQRGAPHVRCVTSRGHLISSAVFTAEDDDDEQATNDDRILSCCRNLERGVAEQQTDGGQHLTREVVLLTDDRNLRLKALSMDVPTRTVPDFLSWAS